MQALFRPQHFPAKRDDSFSREPIAALLVREMRRLYDERRMTPGPSGGGNPTVMSES